MSVLFDGKAVAKQKEEKLEKEVLRLNKKGISPKLVSIVIGESKSAKFYQILKKKAAQRIGLKLEIKSLLKEVSKAKLSKLIQKLNKDPRVHGIMIQLPIPSKLRKNSEILNEIDPKKDVDGLRQNGLYVAPVVKAILLAIKVAGEYLPREPKTVVIGADGFVGNKAAQALTEMGYEVVGIDIETKDLGPKTKTADLLILASGRPSLIKKSMIKNGSVVIDVGAPRGDLDPKAYEMASFITPVPGGIGPVTIACLMENLTIAASNMF